MPEQVNPPAGDFAWFKATFGAELLDFNEPSISKIEHRFFFDMVRWMKYLRSQHGYQDIEGRSLNDFIDSNFGHANRLCLNQLIRDY